MDDSLIMKKPSQTSSGQADKPANSATGVVFISYSRKDQKKVLEYVDCLRNDGVKVWIDQSVIEGSNAWAAEIAKAIRTCDVFLLFLSEASVSSENVTKELNLAVKNKKTIFPVKIEPVEIPDDTDMCYHLTNIHYLEVYQSPIKEEFVAKVIHSARKAFKKRLVVYFYRSMATAFLILLAASLWHIARGDSIPSSGNKGAVGMGKLPPTGQPSPPVTAAVGETSSQEAVVKDSRIRVAVLYFDNNNVNREDLQPLAKVLSLVLIDDLKNLKTFDIVEREELQAVLKELKLGQEKAFDAATVAKVGKLLGARQLILGSYLSLFEKLRIDARLVDVETGTILSTASGTGKPNEFDVLAHQIAQKLAAKGDGVLAPAPSSEAALSMEAGVRLGKALDLLDNGETEKAKAQLEALAKEYPAVTPIKDRVIHP